MNIKQWTFCIIVSIINYAVLCLISWLASMFLPKWIDMIFTLTIWVVFSLNIPKWAFPLMDKLKI
jgi:hypothetical protein